MVTKSTKTAFITGITGQDGSYLCEFLLRKGYHVHGLVRRSSAFNRARIDHLRKPLGEITTAPKLHYADLDDLTTIRRLLVKIRPDEIYHLAGQSHVGLSFDIPESTLKEIGNATLGLLEICRDMDYPFRFYNASSSEIFGQAVSYPQNEDTPLRPRSPYGCAKALSTNLCSLYREAHGLFICNGITYNHESPRRGENFVTRKISRTVAEIAHRQVDCLTIGNMDAERDWGWAEEFVTAMWKMLQKDEPDDYVLATGQLNSVRDFVKAAFKQVNIPILFEGSGLDELGRHAETGDVLVRVDPLFFRPVESVKLVGDATKAKRHLGWEAEFSAPDVAQKMTEADWTRLR